MSSNSELLNYIHACIPNVTGVAHAYKVSKGKTTKQYGLAIFVKKKLPLPTLSKREIIPDTIEGQVTDVLEGDFKALPLLLKKSPPSIMAGGNGRTDKWRPAPGGVSCGHPLVTAGSLGGWLYHGSDIVLLSNNHVIANQNDADIGDPTYQQGVYDGGGPGDTLALLGGFHPIDFEGGDNVIDAAFSKVINPADVDWQTLGITTSPIAYKVAATVGMPVTKSGRTTEVTVGVIASVDWAGLINYGVKGVVKYVDQIYIATPGFIGGGDSGSWLLQDKEGADPDTITGLDFAGDQVGRCIANPILPVFADLDIDLAPPSTLEGYVYLDGGIITGAQVICMNLTTEALTMVISDSNGKYSLAGVAHKDQTVILACHYEHDDKVYQKCYYKKVMADPDTQDIAIEEYDAQPNGKQVDFVFTGGGGWTELGLNLERYFGVWR